MFFNTDSNNCKFLPKINPNVPYNDAHTIDPDILYIKNGLYSILCIPAVIGMNTRNIDINLPINIDLRPYFSKNFSVDLT